ncbi:MAG: cyclic nucleotide-binding domain-containing protein [SAR324 cluster bacterium]|nr:cyclic nucleotide-binding domain-containing protein [SAR324 cluster bacterium]
MALPSQITRPERWDVPFGDEMSDDDVERILAIPPFSRIDERAFPRSTPLRGILLNDTRIERYTPGELVVIEKDYGNSAFFILSGTVRVELEKEGEFHEEKLWRKHHNPKGWMAALAQLWRNPKLPETRNPAQYEKQIGKSGEPYIRSDRKVRIRLKNVSQILKKYKTVPIEKGQFFGEISALGRTPRTASIFAEEETELLEIRWQGLRELRQRVPEIKEHIDRLYRERALSAELQDHPIFAHLPGEDLQHVIDQTEFATFGNYDWFASFNRLAEKKTSERLKNEPLIALEGHHPNGLMIVRSGFARVSHAFGEGHRTISYIGKGQSYGLSEIVHNWKHQQQEPYQYSLRAIGYVDMLLIPTVVMEKLVLPGLSQKLLPPRLEKLSNNRGQLPELDAKIRRSQAEIDDKFLEFLVENRFMNGTATMLIDMDRCVHCDDCVRACAAAHNNNPRFIRHGPTEWEIMVANSCMHCMDPVCMIGCPTGAIHRSSQGQVVIDDATCIGCTTCANSCPYHNIRMVQIRNASGKLILGNDNAPIIKATKCDLCIDQLKGPACQRACPHDALKRINMFERESLIAWLNR